jgi:anti-anti-sigma regulatory factor
VTLTYDVRPGPGGRACIELSGALDRPAAVRILHQALATALERHPTVVVVDLTGVSAINAAGVAALQAARLVGGSAGYRMHIQAADLTAVERLTRHLSTPPRS